MLTQLQYALCEWISHDVWNATGYVAILSLCIYWASITHQEAGSTCIQSQHHNTMLLLTLFTLFFSLFGLGLVDGGLCACVCVCYMYSLHTCELCILHEYGSIHTRKFLRAQIFANHQQARKEISWCSILQQGHNYGHTPYNSGAEMATLLENSTCTVPLQC